MAETTGNGEPQEASPAPAQPDPAAHGEPGDSGMEDVAALRAEYERLRTENGKLRANARSVTAEAEKNRTLEERLAFLESQNESYRKREQESKVATVVSKAAAKAGFRNPEIAWSLIRDAVEVDEDGNVSGLDRALSDLLLREPYLAKPVNPDAGGGPRGRGTTATEPTTSELLRAALGR